ncbi:uncharacterized protein LOC117569468 [Drosophila albomicans]|uniref:Uncharacterized protein LOC117569468 n=1 Tax=Drosophila albomicans TaxID=7291 RepID=A0A6P8YH52_DROAB|nr:uncharacterized protein LOC117569468 [Drosophila albomicans]
MSVMLVTSNYWSTVLSFLAQQYLMDSHATCILWHPSFDISLETNSPLAVIHLEPQKWFNSEHIADYERKRAELEKNRVEYNEWILQLTLAIEQSHCENFIAFQEHIPQFAHSFYNASIYAIWRSTRNRFIFVYSDELLPTAVDASNYFDGYIFHDQPNILLVNAPLLNSTIFEIKSNQFVGPRYFGKEPMPVSFDTLQIYDAQLDKVLWDGGIDLTNKLRNLQGREIVLGIFNYKPFMVVDYDKQPKVYNRAQHGAEVHIDGTEVRLLLIFCELHNCTVQADTTEPSEWGDIYENYTGTGLMGMVLDRTTDYGIGGLYVWYEAYLRMDISQFLGRSGVTCLVPAPHPIINWALPLRPFQATLWICVIACLMLECISLTCTRQCERSSVRSWQQSLRFGFVSTLKLFVNQSTSYVATSYSLRTVLLASYMIDIILTTVYGGGLAAILTLPKLEEAADSRQRLYEHKLTWTATSHAWISIFDVDTADPILLRLMERFRVYDADNIAIKSRTEQMGFVVERMQFGHLANAEIIPDDSLSRLKLMVDDIYFIYTVAYVPRLWAHLDAHSQFTLAWHSSGFDKYWEWKIAADYMSANRQNRMAASQIPKLDIGPVELGIDNFIGLILLWCFGMTCSLLAFVAEIWCHPVDRF